MLDLRFVRFSISSEVNFVILKIKIGLMNFCLVYKPYEATIPMLFPKFRDEWPSNDDGRDSRNSEYLQENKCIKHFECNKSEFCVDIWSYLKHGFTISLRNLIRIQNTENRNSRLETFLFLTVNLIYFLLRRNLISLSLRETDVAQTLITLDAYYLC